jgi:hypothetical protein
MADRINNKAHGVSLLSNEAKTLAPTSLVFESGTLRPQAGTFRRGAFFGASPKRKLKKYFG